MWLLEVIIWLFFSVVLVWNILLFSVVVLVRFLMILFLV